MIHGYPFPTSVAPGEALRLHVSTTAKRFAADFFRQQERLTPLLTHEYPAHGFADPGTAASDWNWPAYPFVIPASWGSGVYLVRLREGEASSALPAPGQPPDPELLFVVRNRTPQSSILFKLPLASYHAYNAVGGGSLYETPSFSAHPAGRVVTLLRPGGGVGGVVPCFPDAYRPDTTRHTFYHWDAPFLSWLQRHGYHVDCCTNLDLHADAQALDGYSLLVIGAHDEYWSAAERHVVERFVARGGNVAIFGGNTCWWRVQYDAQMTNMICHKGDDDGVARDQWWLPQGAARPEDSLTGVSYRNGGGWWESTREPVGYMVQDATHWVFEGTSLRRGDCFGQETWPPLVGYECDGVPLRAIDAHGRAQLHPDAAVRGTPAHLEILGVGRLGSHWQDLPAREDHPEGEGIHAATMVVHHQQGTVFNAATTDWVTVATSGQCPAVERITHNVLRRLSPPTA
ncbi:MAG: hypothetical protein JO022_06115 [Acidobacteriaceae bacterium]|nr:hypothetical protein [Acidobacteriaceae bacterium]